MLRTRRGHERGGGEHGWLQTKHTFSFADYYDPEYSNFRALRVMNEDHIAPGQGFGMHGHREMEIVTYVLDGALEHRDSLGHGEVLRPGELQRMTAGTGIRHSEFNPSPSEPVHLYQIWLTPAQLGLPPSYEQRAFDESGRRGRWQLVADPYGAEGALTIHTDARLYLAQVDADSHLQHTFSSGRHGWLQVLRGETTVNDLPLQAGDGLAISDEPRLTLRAVAPSEVLLFDLA